MAWVKSVARSRRAARRSETEVGYYSRSKHDVPYAYHASLASLAEWSDILMVAVRAGAGHAHAVDADILKKLGPQGTIVNISRVSVIDQKALVAALESNAIAGAGLDVYEKEPHAAGRADKIT